MRGNGFLKMKTMKMKYLFFTVLAAESLFIGLNAADNSQNPAASPGAIEKIKIATSDITIRKTLGSATRILCHNNNYRKRAAGRAGQPEEKPSVVSMHWNASVPSLIYYIFYGTELDAMPSKKAKQPGTWFYSINVQSDGKPPGLPPYMIVRFPSVDLGRDFAFNKELLPIGESFMDIDEIIQMLQSRLTIDLGLDLRRKFCPCGPVQFKLVPNIHLSNRVGTNFCSSCILSLYADYKRLAGSGGCVKRGCNGGTSIPLRLDYVTGDYRVSDYWDGLVYIQYTAGLKPVPEGKNKRAEAVGHLKNAFLLFDSLFGNAADPAENYGGLLMDNTVTGLKGNADSNARKREYDEFGKLHREMTGERLKSIREAVRLRPRLAMAHAALGLLLSQDCVRHLPPGKGNCEKGILSLLKARGLAPGLAFPAYVLVQRVSFSAFPAKLKPLLKEDPEALCDKFKTSAPAWDWAFYSVCGSKLIKSGKPELVDEYIRRIQAIPVIRPGNILLGYLEMELSGK